MPDLKVHKVKAILPTRRVRFKLWRAGVKSKASMFWGARRFNPIRWLRDFGGASAVADAVAGELARRMDEVFILGDTATGFVVETDNPFSTRDVYERWDFDGADEAAIKVEDLAPLDASIVEAELEEGVPVEWIDNETGREVRARKDVV